MVVDKYIPYKTLFKIAFIIVIFFGEACKKDTDDKKNNSHYVPSAGESIADIKEFETKLSADSLRANETGEWSLINCREF